jgi:hypothetical protein
MASVAYLDVAGFTAATLIPDEFILDLDTRYPEFLPTRLLYASARIDSRLTKRYDAPFKTPYPVAVLDWLTRIVSHEAWLKRGRAASDEDAQMYMADHDQAWADIKEAADSEIGLFDLPLRSNTDQSGIQRGFPRVYSQQSPYAWSVAQARIGHMEDENA